MAFQTALLKSISQTKYLSADKYIQNREIMRIFYLKYQKMHYQLGNETILVQLHEDAASPNIHRKVYTVADFKNR